MTGGFLPDLRRARLALALQLDPLDPPAREEIVRDAVVETGGAWIEPPAPGNTWGPHFFELSLFGICQSGNGAEEAIRLWIDAVKRVEAAADPNRGCAA